LPVRRLLATPADRGAALVSGGKEHHCGKGS
jgi:hypothetical protein